MKNIIILYVVLFLVFSSSLYASFHYAFFFDNDKNYKYKADNTEGQISIEPPVIGVYVTTDQFNTGFTNLSLSVQNDLRDQAIGNSLSSGQKRSSLVEKYFIMEINNTRNGATNQISEDSLMDWMVEQ